MEAKKTFTLAEIIRSVNASLEEEGIQPLGRTEASTVLRIEPLAHHRETRPYQKQTLFDEETINLLTEAARQRHEAIRSGLIGWQKPALAAVLRQLCNTSEE